MSLRQCMGFVSAVHVDEAESLAPVQKAAAGASAKIALKERSGWGKAACRGTLAKGCFTDLGSIAGYTRARTQARSLTHAHTQPLGAAPRSSLICKEGSKTSQSSRSGSC